MAKLHLVDATYELFRAYFAMPSIESPEGQPVAAVYGLVSTLLKLLRDPAVTHVGCATDHVVESFRNDLYDGYKTGEGLEEGFPGLPAQFPLAEEAIQALGVVLWPMVEFEADDALAAATHSLAGEFEKVVICTPDKDLAQCVRGDQVVLWDRRREVVYDEEGVVEKWGVPPVSIPDYLALVGDAADGLPGVPAWGAKSTSKVLTEYKAIEAIPADPQDWSVKVRGAKRLSTSLEDNREDALLYKLLATLRTDVPLKEKAKDLEWQGVPKKRYEAFCDRMGFGRIKARPHKWA